MTDKAKTINIINHPLQIPKFHGHMKLELTGAREKVVVEHDNNMTDALEKLFDNKGIWYIPYTLINDMCPTVEKALGGILLTDKTIPDGNLFVPAGTEVTACASYNIANSDDALTMGSYNQQESALDVSNKKMTYVYDWTTNQGNGTIAAACLTHVNAGYAGYGDANLTSGSGNGINLTYNSTQRIQTMIKPIYNDDEYMYTAELAAGVIVIKKIRNCFRSIEPISVMFGQTNYMDYKTIASWEIQCDSLSDINTMCSDGTDVYMCNPSVAVNPGGTLQLHKFSFTDTEVTYERITVTNTSTRTVNTYNGIMVVNGYLYISTMQQNQEKYLIEINILNNADTNEYVINPFEYLNGATNINGKIFMSSNQSGRRFCVFDTITKTIKYTKCNTGYIASSYTGDIWNRLNAVGSYSGSNIIKMLNYLATINNLEKPVTKTADKTMKVSYTIQG